MEEQMNLFNENLDIGFFPKKDIFGKTHITTIDKTIVNKYNCTIICYDSRFGNRKFDINSAQYNYLKNNYQKLHANGLQVYLKAIEFGINEKTKKQQYSLKVSVDGETFI